jgi:hemolysin III
MAIIWTEENASQESLNAWTHGFGFLLSIPGGIALYYLAAEHRVQLVWACLIYSLSLTALYLFSTLSHAVREPDLRHRFRACDQGFVYTLIAGTFTPFVWSYMDSWPRIGLLLFIWLAAATGFYSKVFAKHRINNMTSISYILLGWIPAMVLLGYVSTACFLAMAIGGVLYTVGTLFLQNDHRSWYFHAVWHLLVILASMCHYTAIVVFTVLQIDG